MTDDGELRFTLINARAGHMLPSGDPERYLDVRATLLDGSGAVSSQRWQIGQTWVWSPVAEKTGDNRLNVGERRELRWTQALLERQSVSPWSTSASVRRTSTTTSSCLSRDTQGRRSRPSRATRRVARCSIAPSLLAEPAAQGVVSLHLSVQHHVRVIVPGGLDGHNLAVWQCGRERVAGEIGDLSVINPDEDGGGHRLMSGDRHGIARVHRPLEEEHRGVESVYAAPGLLGEAQRCTKTAGAVMGSGGSTWKSVKIWSTSSFPKSSIRPVSRK